jgi:hypothetical protein
MCQDHIFQVKKMRKFARKKKKNRATHLRSKEEDESVKKKCYRSILKKKLNNFFFSPLNGGLSMLCCHFHIPKDLGRHFEKHKPLSFSFFETFVLLFHLFHGGSM